MSIATAQATCRLRSRHRRRGARACCSAIVEHRADYLYVLPALVVMLVVIAYPIYYTIELSFFKTPAEPADEGQDLRRARQLRHDPDQPVTSASVTVNTLIWTVFSTLFAFVLGLGAALALHREFAGRGLLRAHASHPLRGQRGRRLLRLEVALPLRLRRHRRARRAARPDRRADQLPRQHRRPCCPR